MSSTKIARRSDSLYYDNLSRRAFCDMIAHLEVDIEEERAKRGHWYNVAQELMSLAGDKDSSRGDSHG